MLYIGYFIIVSGHNIRKMITQDKAPNEFNNTPLADQQFRVLPAPSALSTVSNA